MTVRIAPKASADLHASLDYIRRRNPAAAHKLAERVFAIIEKLAAGDFEGHQQRLLTGEVVRSWPVPPFRIYYQRRSDVFLVLRIYHQARRPIAR
ncbi:MAG TPA: type II toxin-antitoxin system RelE/ParE family toxin [Polyangia bacterium]|nr:type II toxin-antitoxin system RelE/ParE family toxin [Polyangia bacterium]